MKKVEIAIWNGLIWFFLTVYDLLSVSFTLSPLKGNVKFHCKTIRSWEMPLIYVTLRQQVCLVSFVLSMVQTITVKTILSGFKRD